MPRVGKTSQRQEKQGTRYSPAGFAQPARDGFPTYEEIARRAYEIYVARGGGDGHDLEDWFQAEREVRESYAKSRRN